MFAIRAISSRSRAIAAGTRSTMLLEGVHRAPLFEKRREIVRRIVEVLLVAGGWRRLPVAAHYADRAVAACRGDRYHMPRTCPGRRRSAWSAGRRREPARRWLDDRHCRRR